MNTIIPSNAPGPVQINEVRRIMKLLQEHCISVDDVHYSNGLGRIYLESAYITVSESGRAFVISSHEQIRRILHAVINSK